MCERRTPLPCKTERQWQSPCFVCCYQHYLTCALPWCSDDPSPASIYHERDNNLDATFLIDEGDNLGLFKDERIRRLFIAGHKQGGAAVRIIDGRPRKFDLFGPWPLPPSATCPGRSPAALSLSACSASHPAVRSDRSM